MNNLSVCTYNIGARINDYFRLCEYLDSSFHIQNREEEENFQLKYDATQSRTAELLSYKAEVYCLQEVISEERPLVKSLKERDFEIVYLEDLPSFDNAIALDKGRFKDIINHSINVQITPDFKKDVAIATATDVLSGQRLTFVSAHVPGFDFARAVQEEDAAEGDRYCQAIIKKLAEIGPSTLQVIGADMNANPEKWDPRFRLFSNQGFHVYRKSSATNVNPRDAIEQEREIDFIFTKTTLSLWQKIWSVFVSSIHFETTIKIEDAIGWNVDENASDHLPVFIDISHQVNISKMRQVWNATYRLLSSCFSSRQLQTI